MNDKEYGSKESKLKRVALLVLTMIACNIGYNLKDYIARYEYRKEIEIARQEATLEEDNSPIIEFEDVNFKNYFLRRRIDLNNDNEISEYEASYFIGEKKRLFIIEDIPNLSSIKGIEGFKGIKSINLDGPIKSLEPLKYCKDLEYVNIGESEITDVSPLVDLPKLEGVILVNGKVSDLSPLFELNKDFSSFNFNGNPLKRKSSNTVFIGFIGSLLNEYPVYVDKSTINITEMENSLDIQFECPNLKNALLEINVDIDNDGEINKYEANRIKGKLDLNNLDIKSVEGLENFINVSHLEIKENNISNADCLSNLNKLWYLDLSSNELSSLRFDSGFSRLFNLNLADNLFSTIKNINCIDSLNTLCLAGNKLRDLNGVDQFENLENLWVSHCNIRSIDTNTHKSRLRILDLEENPLKSLEGVEVFECLEFLSLSGCNIESIKNTNGIQRLEELRLDDNPLKSIDGVEKFSNLINLNINHTLVSDITPIKMLSDLRYLSISDTLINDISPVISLINLERLSANNLKLINGYYPRAVKLGEVSGYEVFTIKEQD